jgi:predicted metal-dependent HD superfamily phosphohydrolase
MYLLWVWFDTHRQLGLKTNIKEYWKLRARHQTPDRAYHTWHHIAEAIRFTRAKSYDSEDMYLAIMALFFHDAHMVMGAKDNEEISAQLWEAYGERIQAQNILGWPLCRSIGDAIRCTKSHQIAPMDPWFWKVVNDSDMAILASEPKVYHQYAKDIWREFRFVPQPKYIMGRLGFLNSQDPNKMFFTFLDNDQDFKDRVRANLDWEIDTLSNRPLEIVN